MPDVLASLALALPRPPAADFPRFQAQEIDPHAGDDRATR